MSKTIKNKIKNKTSDDFDPDYDRMCYPSPAVDIITDVEEKDAKLNSRRYFWWSASKQVRRVSDGAQQWMTTQKCSSDPHVSRDIWVNSEFLD